MCSIMSNITLSIQDKVLKASREYARKHNLSLNALVRYLLSKTVKKESKPSWIQECFKLMDQAEGDSKGEHWKREDLYRG